MCVLTGSSPNITTATTTTTPRVRRTGPVYAVDFSPNHDHLISGSADTTIRLWDLDTRSCLVVYRSHALPVWDVKFGPFGLHFVSASRDRTARVWRTDRAAPLRILTSHFRDVEVCRGARQHYLLLQPGVTVCVVVVCALCRLSCCLVALLLVATVCGCAPQLALHPDWLGGQVCEVV